MRKTLTILTVLAAAASLAACDMFKKKDADYAEKPPVAATSTETATTTPPADTASMTATPPATEQPAPTQATK